MNTKDYLLKQLHQFLDELRQRINTIKKSEIQDLEIQLNKLYKDYFEKDKNQYLKLTVNQIVEEIGNSDRIELLAELFVYDAQLTKTNNYQQLLRKAQKLLLKVDQHSKTYSYKRNQKIKEIEQLLTK